MYKIHKKENERKLTESNAYIKPIDSDIDIKKITSIDGMIQIHGINNGVREEKTDNKPKLMSAKKNQFINGGGGGMDNSAYDDTGDSVLHGTIEIIKELPALHIERCKL